MSDTTVSFQIGHKEFNMTLEEAISWRNGKELQLSILSGQIKMLELEYNRVNLAIEHTLNKLK